MRVLVGLGNDPGEGIHRTLRVGLVLRLEKTANPDSLLGFHSIVNDQELKGEHFPCFQWNDMQ
jgi:hypothetical protein